MKILRITFFAIAMMISNQLFAGGADQLIVDQLIKEAESTRVKAAKAGFEWTATAALIEDAKIAAKKGNADLAATLAKKAIKQGENSLLQAKYAKAHWQESALR